MQESLAPSVIQLLGQAPVMLVYLAAAVLALTLWKRHPLPSVLTLSAVGLMIVTSALQAVVTQHLLTASNEQGWDHQRTAMMLSGSGIIASLLRALGVGLLVAAVFVGRERSAPRDA